MTTSVSATIPATSPGKSTPPARDMPSHAAGSRHDRASSASRAGYTVRQSSSSGTPSTGGVSVSSPNSFRAAAVNASASPPTCATRSLRLSFSHGVRPLSCSSVTCINTSDVRRHAEVKSIMCVLTSRATVTHRCEGSCDANSRGRAVQITKRCICAEHKGSGLVLDGTTGEEQHLVARLEHVIRPREDERAVANHGGQCGVLG